MAHVVLHLPPGFHIGRYAKRPAKDLFARQNLELEAARCLQQAPAESRKGRGGDEVQKDDWSLR